MHKIQIYIYMYKKNVALIIKNNYCIYDWFRLKIVFKKILQNIIYNINHKP